LVGVSAARLDNVAEAKPNYWLRVFPTEETYLQALVIANLLLLPPDPV
jgi:hypothetical protein